MMYVLYDSRSNEFCLGCPGLKHIHINLFRNERGPWFFSIWTYYFSMFKTMQVMPEKNAGYAGRVNAMWSELNCSKTFCLFFRQRNFANLKIIPSSNTRIILNLYVYASTYSTGKIVCCESILCEEILLINAKRLKLDLLTTVVPGCTYSLV